MSQVNVSHLTFDNDNTIYNLEDETARAEIAALHVELTQAEYDALTPEEKNNGTEYFITDSTDSGDFSYLENRINALDGKSNTLNEIATLEVTDVKGVIHTSASPKYTFIKNKGENDCYISETNDVGEGVDGTILLQSNSTVMLENLSDVNYICKSGETTIICVCFQNSVNDPFARDESIGSSGGGTHDSSKIINIIPLVTPSPVQFEGSSGSVSLQGTSSLALGMSKDYGSYISAYIDVSSIISNDILCNSAAKIRLLVSLGANTTLTSTLQMYIGSEPPTENDWVTVASEKVNSEQRIHTIKSISELNPSGTTDGRIYFRHIHGTESNSYTTYAIVRCLQVET